jgi:RimJ/RimL family protein N-acetyltransferase
MKDPSFSELITKRLVVRRFDSEDAEALAVYRSDENVSRYQDWEAPYPLSEARKFIASLRGLAPGTAETWFQFAIGLLPSRHLIGDVALRTTERDPRQAELGFTLAQGHQGCGYASEAVGAAVSYAFGQLAMHRVFSITDSRNLAAQRLLVRLGFRREGEFIQNSWFKGEWTSEILYARLSSESSPGTIATTASTPASTTAREGEGSCWSTA